MLRESLALDCDEVSLQPETHCPTKMLYQTTCSPELYCMSASLFIPTMFVCTYTDCCYSLLNASGCDVL